MAGVVMGASLDECRHLLHYVETGQMTATFIELVAKCRDWHEQSKRAEAAGRPGVRAAAREPKMLTAAQVAEAEGVTERSVRRRGKYYPGALPPQPSTKGCWQIPEASVGRGFADAG